MASQIIIDQNAGTITIGGNNVVTSAAAGGASSAALTVSQSGNALTLTPNLFGSGAAGVVPSSGGGSTNFLRADGTWQAPPGTGGGVALNTSTQTGSTYTLPTTNQNYSISCSGNSNFSFAITMPASPSDKDIIRIAVYSFSGIGGGGLTISANSGQTMISTSNFTGSTIKLGAWQYQSSNTSWYPIA